MVFHYIQTPVRIFGDHKLDSGLSNGVGVKASLISKEVSGGGAYIGVGNPTISFILNWLPSPVVAGVKKTGSAIYNNILSPLLHLAEE